MMFRSLKRLNRKGCTAAGRIRSAEIEQHDRDALRAVHRARAHCFDQFNDMLGRRLRHAAMAEIEDQRALAQRIEDPMDGASHALAADHQPARIEIALHHALGLHRIACPGGIDMLVEAESRRRYRPRQNRR